MQLKELLEELVSHDSTFGNEGSIAGWLSRYLEKQGFSLEKHFVSDGRFNILASRGDAKRAHLLCYGHLDTVPVYHGWKTDPFSLTQRGDKLYGLGACDMKGGIAAMLFALQNIPRSSPVKLLLAVDEENASLGAWRVVQEHADWLDGITHMISAEPGASGTRLGGSDVLTLGRRGRARFIIRVNGFSAHGGHVDRGVNAIDIAACITREITAMSPTVHPRLKEGSQYVACIRGESKGLSIPEYCELEIERHLVLPETVQGCMDKYDVICQKVIAEFDGVKEALPFIKASVELVPRENKYMEPYEIPQDDSLVKTATRVIESTLGIEKVTINYGRSVGDENVFANELQLRPLVYGPEGGNIHSPNEWISAKSLEEAATVYQKILLEYLAQ